jgi:hypothetical protein
MRIVGFMGWVMLVSALELTPVGAQQLSPDRRPIDRAESGREQDKADDKARENPFEGLLDLFSGRSQRTGAEGRSCSWDSCPGDMQCCCCGDRCVCKKECSFQPCR